MDEEAERLKLAYSRKADWLRWGPYLPERQWGTVREDYSAGGDCWNYFPHDHARSRAYRWGEDGLMGICDRQCRLGFSFAFWNHRDAILKERLFGLTNGEGNHGEDVKEVYHYLESSPTHSWMRGLYRYPQAAFPYSQLIEENRRRGLAGAEFELQDSGVFDDGRYFDCQIDYAKAGPEDILIRLTLRNRGPDEAPLDVLGQLVFRNTWSWGCREEDCGLRPRLILRDGAVNAEHPALGTMRFEAEDHLGWLFTENESNSERLFGVPNPQPFVKDAFHRHIILGEADAINPAARGSKAAAHWRLQFAPYEEKVIRLRLRRPSPSPAFGPEFDAIWALRREEMLSHYRPRLPETASRREVVLQAWAGLLWSKQFYHIDQRAWLKGDPEQPPPPGGRQRNQEWSHLYNRDIISMPDKWEYPWYAAWDLAFHCVAFAEIDAEFAKGQLILLLREWYMHPNGQIPAYEFAFGDVNPPVHAWAAWRVYKMTAPKGSRDLKFLTRVFHKLLLNFTWWVNRKDPEGNNIFAGGFLGMDNVGVFDRSKPLPGGGVLEQADGTAWMAFYCSSMLAIAMELAVHDDTYEDIASKFFEHFVAIVDAMNSRGGIGLWDEEDGFYYDRINSAGHSLPLRLRSLAGLVPLLAVEVLEAESLERLPGFRKRLRWFLDNRPDLAKSISCLVSSEKGERLLLAVPSTERLKRLLQRVMDEEQFLAPFGIRSLPFDYARQPFTMTLDGQCQRVAYEPGDSSTYLFGGNSNWRGPVWMPLNYLIIEALERYHYFYGASFQLEIPSGSGRRGDLKAAATEIGRRLNGLFLPDASGSPPSLGKDWPFRQDSRPGLLFHEFFNPDSGRGLGASHQTGWTALAARLCLRQNGP
ncbi:MAG: hypothetical protein RL095_1546 [Verrucomicrobiota bacterium]|jgi:hypothetical protein